MTAGGHARDEEWAETLEVLADPGLVRDIRAGIDGAARGDVATLDEVGAELRVLGAVALRRPAVCGASLSG